MLVMGVVKQSAVLGSHTPIFAGLTGHVEVLCLPQGSS